MLDGFFGIKYSRAWLKVLGVEYPFGLVRLSIRAWNMGNEMRYSDRYAAKGIPLGPGLDLGRCINMLLV